jgi:hypothetical protein
VISSGALDDLAKQEKAFHKLLMSRLGYSGDEALGKMIFEELKKRKLARDSEDGFDSDASDGALSSASSRRSDSETSWCEHRRGAEPCDGCASGNLGIKPVSSTVFVLIFLPRSIDFDTDHPSAVTWLCLYRSFHMSWMYRGAYQGLKRQSGVHGKYAELSRVRGSVIGTCRVM